MTDEMLVAPAQWLPNYKNEITKAKRHLANTKPIGNMGSEGAARSETMSVEEVRAAGETKGTLRIHRE